MIKILSRVSNTHLLRCDECDALVNVPRLHSRQVACCPQCNAELRSGSRWSLKRCAIIAISILILMPFAFTFPLLSIDLLGVPVHASVWGGAWKIATNNDVYTGFMVLLCAIIMPLCFATLVLFLWIAKHFNHRPRNLLLMLGYIKPWVMLDVYLVSLGVAAFKVREYAALTIDIYFLAFVFTALLTTLLFIKINPLALWNEFYPQFAYPTANTHNKNNELCHCHACNYTFAAQQRTLDSQGRHYCPRCESLLDINDNTKLQRTWAALIAGIIMLIPANLLPISYIYLNGVASGDTLISGVISFIGMGSYFVAFVVFVASIFVPLSKIIAMIYLLISVHRRKAGNIERKMKLLHLVHFVGRWSMLDLFVLSLMMSLVTRGQIITFSVGPAAFYFGAAVFLTMIAAEQFDSRLLWKLYDKKPNSPT
ncbi:paraquat-inducible protein A [Testudinibacter sp. TR-2022]|uniref:paraquat-inducible protein A n=1 Tax=Testudinibacter sp. TR-2022 TaxID=2585029 RepID=UPI001117C1D0|nr:paraquat-inducible protein A [Testudinibacter sp. TR-2022]TNH07086.1 paraquat-inducible protein A [Pasteurellaceae bacterium Phil11]TNH22794.1 paraquat-inducible protein A [Testudinibacter sp. TR-2022]TNH26422.1 paraquat-inducible protein A [Testudinibacter sp. TR-2022]